MGKANRSNGCRAAHQVSLMRFVLLKEGKKINGENNEPPGLGGKMKFRRTLAILVLSNYGFLASPFISFLDRATAAVRATPKRRVTSAYRDERAPHPADTICHHLLSPLSQR